MPAHVGEFVGDGGLEFSVRQRREHISGQNYQFAHYADRDRAEDSFGRPNQRRSYTECLLTTGPVDDGIRRERDGGGGPA